MQVQCTLHFRGSRRYRLNFEKGIKQQSLINILRWTLTLNWGDKKEKKMELSNKA